MWWPLGGHRGQEGGGLYIGEAVFCVMVIRWAQGVRKGVDCI